MDGLEVLEAPELEQLETPVEETQEPVEELADEVEAVEPAGDGRTLPQWIRNLKDADPVVYKSAKADFFGKREMEDKLKDFDLDGTKAWLEEHGGRESLMTAYQEREQKAQAIDNLGNMLATGDAQLARELATNSPEGFAKIAPAMMSEWAKVDQLGYDKAVFGAINSVVQQATVQGLFSEVPVSFPNFLAEVRGAMYSASPEQKSQIATHVLQRVEQLFGSFQQAASAPAQARQEAAPKGQTADQVRAEYKGKIFTDQLTAAEDAQREPLIQSEMASFFARRPNDADAKELAIRTLKAEVKQRMDADKAYQSSRQAFIGRKDKDGLLKLAASREKAAIKEIAPKVGRAIYGAPVAAKATPVASRNAPRVAAPIVSRDPAGDILRRAMER